MRFARSIRRHRFPRQLFGPEGSSSRSRHPALLGLMVVAAITAGASAAWIAQASTGATRIPLIDMGSQTYEGFGGGLYENGTNGVPADHASVGRSRSALVRPLDRSGAPSPTGKIVLLSIGMSNTSDEWCGTASNCTSPSAASFMGKAGASASVNHSTLSIVNGAQGGQDAKTWTSPSAPNYDMVKNTRLAPLGLSERQVQVIWLKEADARPSVALPSASADAYALETNLGAILRALSVRYRNLHGVFLSSRIYAGYATTTLNPEPYAYESGFSVKWLVQAQIDQMRNNGNVVDARAGDLNYNGASSWIAWGPYLWADGTNPRSDGLRWLRSDFQSDGTHPSTSGIGKVSTMLMRFFLNSRFTKCWFSAAGCSA
jgi:hypothetical protein